MIGGLNKGPVFQNITKSLDEKGSTEVDYPMIRKRSQPPQESVGFRALREPRPGLTLPVFDGKFLFWKALFAGAAFPDKAGSVYSL